MPCKKVETMVNREVIMVHFKDEKEPSYVWQGKGFIGTGGIYGAAHYPSPYSINDYEAFKKLFDNATRQWGLADGKAIVRMGLADMTSYYTDMLKRATEEVALLTQLLEGHE